MSDRFYVARYESVTKQHMLAIFSLETKAKDFAIYLIENEQANGTLAAFEFEDGNFVTVMPADPSNLPHHYNDVELEYINNVIPKAY